MASQPEESLDVGLAALKQGDYQKALVILKAVATKEGNNPAGLQAEIGLVVAYARTSQLDEAIALCKILIQSHNSQVKEWAERSLEQLTKSHLNTQAAQASDNTIQNTQALQTSDHISSSVATDNVISKQQEQPRQPEIKENEKSFAFEKGALAIRPKAKTIYWRQAKRAKVWQPLQKLNLIPLRLLMAGTFLALFWVTRQLLVLAITLLNNVLIKLPNIPPIQLNFDLFVFILLLGLICFSPWVLDALLTRFYNQRPLSQETLNRRSRETIRLLQRFCKQQNWRLPNLSVLPISAPVALTYGNLPRNARIVVSQGLLEQLADDEIATIYALELGHIAHGDFVVMSLLLVFTIPVYMLYQQFSRWGDRKSQQVWRSVMGIMASLAYGFWRLLTLAGLFISQLRLYYSDRLTTGITGNPNGLVRALLKISIGLADHVQKEEHTSWQLESLNIAAPVSYQQTLFLGSAAGHNTFESLLMWDYLNPYRWWFVINNTHPLMGDRLQRLSSIAEYWHLEKEVYFASQQTLKIQHQSFFRQIAPYVGILIGFVLAGLMWLVWQIGFTFKLFNLKWIYDDWSFVTGCLLIGWSIGLMIRINYFFPEIKTPTIYTDEDLPRLLANPAAIPIDSVGIRLVGKLLGRCGTSNWLS
ncbi:M48 family metalloprotease, partial [Aetokthonos hydrillicola]